MILRNWIKKGLMSNGRAGSNSAKYPQHFQAASKHSYIFIFQNRVYILNIIKHDQTNNTNQNTSNH